MFQKTILKTILVNPDPLLYASINGKAKEIFTDKENYELFKYLESLNLQYGEPPSTKLLVDLFKMEKQGDIKKTFKELMTDKSIEVSDQCLPLVDAQIKHYIKITTQELLRDTSTELKISSASDVQDLTEELVDELSKMSRLLTTSKEMTSVLTYHDVESGEHNAIKAQAIKAYDLKKTGNQGYFKMKTGLSPLDSVIGGIHSVTFLAILGFVKNGKSFLARKIAYDALCQGKNVMFVTLEMSCQSVLDSFFCLHANNTDIFGYDIPKVKTADIRAGTLSPQAEEFYKNEVIDSFTSSQTMGTLKIHQPTESRYTPSYLFRDVRLTQKTEMDIDLLVIDYPGRMSPDYGAKSRDSMNDIFLQIRNFGLANNIPIVYPVQCNRAGYDSALRDKENLFNIEAISDYSAIEKESTDIISILTTPEMKASGQSQIQHLLSRESDLAPAFRVNADFETGIISPISGISAEDAKQLIDEVEI